MTNREASRQGLFGKWRLPAACAIAAGLLLAAGPAFAQLVPQPTLPAAPQNPFGPTGAAKGANYPYPGQCVVDLANTSWAPGLLQCTPTTAPSFGCEAPGNNSN